MLSEFAGLSRRYAELTGEAENGDEKQHQKSRPMGRLFWCDNRVHSWLEIQIVAGNGCFDPLLTGVHPFF
jgi:hypothetical protein